MADAGVVRDANRLPWLEPYRAPTGKKSSRRAGVTAAIGAIGLAGVVTLLTRDLIPMPVEEVVPQARVTLPSPADMQPQIVLPSLKTAEQVVEVEAKPVAAPAPRRAKKVNRKIHTNPTRTAYGAVMKRQAEALGLEVPAEEKAAKPQVAVVAAVAPTPSNPPLPAVNPAAQVVRGKTVQLGVYLSAAQADLVWRNAIREYTYLVTLPKSIEPISIRSKRYYRLQLGTPSRRHAKQLCSNLQSIGRACTVA